MTPPASMLPGEQSILERAVAKWGKPRVREMLASVRLGQYADVDPELAARSALNISEWIWRLNGRPSQLVPWDRPFRTFLWSCGRSYGKNRAASEAINEVAQWAGRLIARGQLRQEEARILLIGRIGPDVTDAMVGGPSGIVARSAPWCRATHVPSRRRVLWDNGVEALTFSADEPNAVRGQNAIAAWADEIAHWPQPEETFRNIDLAVRIGPRPRVLATTTPRPIPFLRDLIARADTITVTRPTSDNAHNMPAEVIEGYYRTYHGWVAAQELGGELVEEVASYFPRAAAPIVWEPPTDIVAVVRRWDLAASVPSPGNPDPDFTASVKMARRRNGRFIVLDATLVRERASVVEQLILNTAERDGRGTPILLPQDPGQAGKAQVQDLIAKLAGFVVHSERETGPKETRAMPAASQWQGGNIELLAGTWNEPYLAQMEQFPSRYAHDDAPDCTAGAFNHLSRHVEVVYESWSENGPVLPRRW
jgi:predicted phage terminase large subunit-like protein